MLKTFSSITNAIGALNYKGTWNASTNSPSLASGVGTKGDYYVVSVAGATSLDGISNWGVGDLVTFNGGTWQRVEGGADLNGVNLSVSGTSTMGGDVTNSAGNLIFGTAAKGVNFTANTPAAGMTSRLLNWYEEGVWTPVPTNITVNSGVPVWGGYYTRVGRVVTATWRLTGGANVTITTASSLTLPFTSLDLAWGSYGHTSINTLIGGLLTGGASVYFGTAAVSVAFASGTVTYQI